MRGGWMFKALRLKTTGIQCKIFCQPRYAPGPRLPPWVDRWCLHLRMGMRWVCARQVFGLARSLDIFFRWLLSGLFSSSWEYVPKPRLPETEQGCLHLKINMRWVCAGQFSAQVFGMDYMFNQRWFLERLKITFRNASIWRKKLV